MVRMTFAVLLAILPGAPASLHQEKVLEDTWFRVCNNGTRSGYMHWSVRSVKVDGREILRGVLLSSETVVVQGEESCTLAREVNDETPDGKALSMFYYNGLQDDLDTQVIKGDKMDAVNVKAGKERKTTLDWPADGVLRPGQDRLVRATKGAAGSAFAYHFYYSSFGKIVEYQCKVVGREKTTLGGAERELLKVESTAKIGNNPIENWWYDDKLVAAKMLCILGDTEVLYERAEPAAVLFDGDGNLPEKLAAIVHKAKSKPADPRKVARANFKVTFKGGPAPAMAFDGQSAEKPAGLSIAVKVVPMKADSTKRPVTDAKMKEWLDESAHLESKDPGLVKAAKDAVGAETDGWKSAKKLEAWVRTSMKKKPFGSAWLGAKDALAKLEGDCSEHAVLLAAMLRAVGVPSRIVAGLVLVGDNFVPHLWVEAWAGRWAALDAYLVAEPVDAARLKVAESSGGRDLVAALESAVFAASELALDPEWDPRK